MAPGRRLDDATWFQGPAAEYIAASRAGFDQGVSILHFLGGHTSEVNGGRAITQTKMTINQRASVDGVEVDVVCTGRFYDFCAKHDGEWKIVRRQPIYEKDRLDVLDPAPLYWSSTASCWDRSPPAIAIWAVCRARPGSRSGPGCRA